MKMNMLGLVGWIGIFNLCFGALSVIQILSWFGKAIPLWQSIIVGLFGGSITVPVAVIGWLVRTCLGM